MQQPLPLKSFRWCTDNINQIMNTPDDSSSGYILEVDLDYPINLHDYHKDYPLCAETAIPPGGKHKKLLLTLYNKMNYVIPTLSNVEIRFKTGFSLEKSAPCA